MIFKLFAASLLLVICLQPAYSQKNEIGIVGGGSYYLGDLNPSKHFAMTNAAGGIIYRRNFTEHLAVRANAIYGKVEADDAVIGYNTERNLHFRSSIIELSAQAEVNFVPFIAGDIDSPYSFYLIGGIGAFRYNPKAYYNGTWYELRGLGTEGQGSELYPDREMYSLYSYSLIFGVGMKFYISQYITAGLEWGMRRTGTDYLDDVSTSYPDPAALSELASNLSDRSLNQNNVPGMQRGNPYRNDWYSFAGLSITFKINDPSGIRCYTYD